MYTYILGPCGYNRNCGYGYTSGIRILLTEMGADLVS